MNNKCDHGQLYLHVPVTIVVPIEHNSALCVSGAYEEIEAFLEKRGHTIITISDFAVDPHKQGSKVRTYESVL